MLNDLCSNGSRLCRGCLFSLFFISSWLIPPRWAHSFRRCVSFYSMLRREWGKMKRLLFMESCWNYVNYGCHLKSENVESSVSFIWSSPTLCSRVHPVDVEEFLLSELWALRVEFYDFSLLFHSPCSSSKTFFVTKRRISSIFSRFYLRFPLPMRCDCIHENSCCWSW